MDCHDISLAEDMATKDIMVRQASMPNIKILFEGIRYLLKKSYVCGWTFKWLGTTLDWRIFNTKLSRTGCINIFKYILHIVVDFS